MTLEYIQKGKTQATASTLKFEIIEKEYSFKVTIHRGHTNTCSNLEKRAQ